MLLLALLRQQGHQQLTPVAEAEPSLEERIGQAVAAAIAPIAAQLAALQNAGIPGPSPDTPMSTGGAENASDAAAEAAAGVADVAPVIALTGAVAGVADVAGAETVAALQAAARIQSLGARIQSLGAPPASYADKTESAPY